MLTVLDSNLILMLDFQPNELLTGFVISVSSSSASITYSRKLQN